MRYFLDILTVSLKLSTCHVAQMKANSELPKHILILKFGLSIWVECRWRVKIYLLRSSCQGKNELSHIILTDHMWLNMLYPVKAFCSFFNRCQLSILVWYFLITTNVLSYLAIILNFWESIKFIAAWRQLLGRGSCFHW